jgi:hypothetical protein
MSSGLSTAFLPHKVIFEDADHRSPMASAGIIIRVFPDTSGNFLRIALIDTVRIYLLRYPHIVRDTLVADQL